MPELKSNLVSAHTANRKAVSPSNDDLRPDPPLLDEGSRGLAHRTAVQTMKHRDMSVGLCVRRILALVSAVCGVGTRCFALVVDQRIAGVHTTARGGPSKKQG